MFETEKSGNMTSSEYDAIIKSGLCKYLRVEQYSLIKTKYILHAFNNHYKTQRHV